MPTYATPPKLSNEPNDIYAAQPIIDVAHLSGGPAGDGLARDAHEDIVYLGFNNDGHARTKEAASVRAYDKDATILTGNGEDQAMQGKIRSPKDGRVLDLGNGDELHAYLAEIGVGGKRKGESNAQAEKRLAAIEDIFRGSKDPDSGVRSGGLMPGVRDEMAQFVAVLSKVESGQMDMDRVIMSGHSTGEWIYSEEGEDNSSGVSFEKLAKLMKLFPKAQGGVEDVMLSACHTLENYEGHDNTGGDVFHRMFPNAEEMWGYKGRSPNAAGGSLSHVKAFLESSEGHDPDAVARRAKATGGNATVKRF
jgi:hypothetical protein